MKNKDIQNLRVKEKMKKTEEELRHQLNKETSELEEQLIKTLKTLGVVTAGIVGAYTLYKLFSPSKPKRQKVSPVIAKTSSPKLAETIGRSVLSLAITKLLPLAVEKLNSHQSNQTNESTGTTRKK
ncbi:hypothetical protein [Reichenbachiella sp. MSK19-1]|uniref:hypothetical protein n=1 Tax=Reichenbachiella sp. MSK19-1 TaxID=1897631 RepID=UPI000E6C2201|nr:hypothetical protein [Reichenbachiella sp. MSK19-1]RJE70399.1 hypothetical protein BGP76_09910 [Reichenbachiella sp. MSK19-1]